MNKFLLPILSTLVFASPWGLASLAISAPQTGVAVFTTEGRTYQGEYAVKNQAISVNIDGLVYRGNYAANPRNGSPAPGDAQTGNWGRAFLFATSAKVLQCQLDAGFPRVSGRCQSADGRNFDLKPGAPRQPSRTISAK
ncbi:hypothetical protein [Polaromonas sp.]|uniref:hypothetical protein n=1 Tax=Polaromonas sp. TaxID=1869339 RepID=UPI003752E995